MENNVSIGLFLDTRREMKKLGARVFGVKADLRYMGRRWQFATPFAMTIEEWNSIGSRKIRSEALKELKIKMEAYRTKAVNIIESQHPFSYKNKIASEREFPQSISWALGAGIETRTRINLNSDKLAFIRQWTKKSNQSPFG